MHRYPRLTLTGRITLLVSLLGALTIITIAYALASLRTIERDYHALLDRDARASMLISAALVDLSDSSHRVLSVLTEQEVGKMRQSQQQLNAILSDFDDKLTTIAPLLPENGPELDGIRQQKRQLSEQANAVIDAAARWRGDRALRIIHQQFDPTLKAIRQDMDGLRTLTTEGFNASADILSAAAHNTVVNTSIAVLLGLALILGLSTYLSLTQITRPIRQLTKAMINLSQGNYAYPVQHTERQDELGSMARALWAFKNTMKRADRLEREASIDAEKRRISQQLIDLTEAIPGAVFQLRITPDGAQQVQFLSGKAPRYIGDEPLHTSAGGLRMDHIRVDKTPETTRALDHAISQSLTQLYPLDLEMEVDIGRRRLWLKTLATAKRTPEGDTLLNGIWLDISERKAQALALKSAKEQAEQAANAKAAFLASMSHEIRTPMNAILGLAQLALKQPMDGLLRDYMAKILRSGNHLLSIINDILDFSKIDGGHLIAEHIPFSPQQLLQDTQQMLATEARTKGLTIELEPTQDLPVLLGDPMRISQILLNYTSNAIKFSTRGTITLQLSLQQDDEGHTFLCGSVSDQGIGLSQQQLGQLFRPFQQADNSISRRFGGTGLGLAIALNLAELMHGNAGAESEPGKGSRFWFRVRVEIARPGVKPSETAPPKPPQVAPALAGMRILVVDDNDLNRLVASEFLKEAGVQVDEASSGYAAIQALTQDQHPNYHAVLMDLMMPGLDGLSTTAVLRQHRRLEHLPIIAMSANASQENARQCLLAGMRAHIGKPIDQQQLWSILSELSQETLPALPAEPAATPAEDPATPVLEPQVLEALRTRMNSGRFIAMLSMLLADCETRARHFHAHSTGMTTTELDQDVHDLISTAGHAGLRKLEHAARALQSARLQSADDRTIRQLCLAIHQTAQESIAALNSHFQLGP